MFGNALRRTDCWRNGNLESAKRLLFARQVQTAGFGELRDGAGLLLRVKAKSASWVFRFTAPSGRRRELGLGSTDRTSLEAAGASLKRARKNADEARDLLDRKPPVDPIDARADAREAARKAETERKVTAKRERTTLCRVARAYHESTIEPSRTLIHSKEWIGSLEPHVPKKLWNAPIDGITAPDLLAALADVVAKYPETGGRVRQRLEAAFDDAQFHGLCSSNPARSIRRKLAEGGRGQERGRLRALSYQELPAFLAELQKVEGISARALEFAVPCASGSSEVRFTRWAEIDMQREIWTVPATRMKGRQEHLVDLSDRALQLLEGQRGIG
jgi:hypothetical protein